MVLDKRYQRAIKRLSLFYPNNPYQSDPNLRDFQILRKILGDAFEVQDTKITSKNYEKYMSKWERNVRLIIGDELFERIQDCANNQVEKVLFTDSIYSNPTLDANTLTAIWIFKNLPTPPNSRETVINDLLPMGDSLTVTVLYERKILFKKFLDEYRKEALDERHQEFQQKENELSEQYNELNKQIDALKSLEIDNTPELDDAIVARDEALSKRDEYMNTLAVYIAKRDHAQQEYDELHEKYLSLVNERREIVAETRDVSDKSIKAYYYNELNIITPDADEDDLIKIDTDKLSRRLYQLRKRLRVVSDDIIRYRMRSESAKHLLDEANKDLEPYTAEYNRLDKAYEDASRRVKALMDEKEEAQLAHERVLLDYNNKLIHINARMRPIKRVLDGIKARTNASHVIKELKERQEQSSDASEAPHREQTLESWLKTHVLTPQQILDRVNKVEADILAGRLVRLDDLTNTERAELQYRFPSIAKRILDKVPANGAVYVNEYYAGENVLSEQMNYEDLKELFDIWLEEGFEFKYGSQKRSSDEDILKEDNSKKYGSVRGSDGDRVTFNYSPEGDGYLRVWELDSFQIEVVDSPHAAGGNFCPYILRSKDKEIVKYCRERLQIYDHIPQKHEVELLEPCLIHAIICGLKHKNYKEATPRQKEILKEQLYSRIRTRFIPVSGLHKLCNEFGLFITISNIDGDEIKSIRPKDKIEYSVSLILWEDHHFVDEYYAAKRMRTNELVKDLDLEPMRMSQSYIFNQRLKPYEPNLINAYSKSMFKTAKQLIEEPDTQFEGIMKFEKQYDLSNPTLENAPVYAYNLFLKYLVDKNINALAVSGIPKAFIQKSIRAGVVVIAHNKPQIPNEPVTMLDVNSSYSNAEAQVAIPLGLPRVITSTMSWDDVLSKPCFVVEANITKFHRRHALDMPLIGKHVLNNIDIEYLPIEFDRSIPPRGYYWDFVEKGALKEFVTQLFEIKLQNRALGKAMLNTHIGMFGRKNPAVYLKRVPFHDLKSHPLARRCIRGKDGTTYSFYHEYDYTYNFSMIYSLILSQAKANNDKIFRYCHDNSIPMYYSSCDSIAIPTRCLDLMRHLIDENELGKLKIEAQSDNAIFISWGMYYMNDKKWCTQSATHELIERYCNENHMSIREMFDLILKDRSILSRAKCYKRGRNDVK